MVNTEEQHVKSNIFSEEEQNQEVDDITKIPEPISQATPIVPRKKTTEIVCPICNVLAVDNCVYFSKTLWFPIVFPLSLLFFLHV